MAQLIDPKAFRFALAKVEDGILFEKFCHSFLSGVLGYAFEPAGGIHDRGIDGLEHTFVRKGTPARSIYQASIEKNAAAKIERSLVKLAENGIPFDDFVFVTNQDVPDKDLLIDRLYPTHQKSIRIWDLGWLSINANNSSATQNAYQLFISSYLHEFAQPGQSYVVSDLVTDPRLYVFLRQQWDANRSNSNLEKILAETLILYALEGTDPDKDLFKTAEEINQVISSLISFDLSLITSRLEERLATLPKKPKATRLVHHHPKKKAYCLSLAARQQIQQRNLDDRSLQEEFQKSVETKLKSYLSDAAVSVRDCVKLIEDAIHRIYYQQGLEFSNFVLKGGSQAAVEKSLPDLLGQVVDASTVVMKNKEKVKSALLMTIRDVVYNGSDVQKDYLRRLCNTYMMLFTLQCDPKLSTYFSEVANRLRVYVCTSIIVPALSEYFLDDVNRRHWNLLKGAREAGVTLLVNEIILDELVSHFRRFTGIFKDTYQDAEDLYIGDENQSLYVDEIMIRSYFYARARDRVQSFTEFVETFLNADLSNARTSMRLWLEEEFGILFQSDVELGCHLDPKEEQKLFLELRDRKNSAEKARSDARLILTVHAIREKNKEGSSATAGQISGYRTWWLSKDTITQKAMLKVFGEKYSGGCYMRPDFLYNYVALAPRKSQVDATYRELFPTLIGVNISFHMPPEVVESVHKLIKDHNGKNNGRLRSLLHELGESLKSDPSLRGRQSLTHFLDERVKVLHEGTA